MRIPIYEQQVAPQEGQAPGIPALSAPPPSAFGTGIAEQGERLGATLEQAGSVLGEHLIRRAQLEGEAQVVAADNQFKMNLHDSMYNPEPDDKTGVPKGVFLRQGFQAQGALEDFRSQYRQMQTALVDSMDTPYKKRRLNELTNENFRLMDDRVAKHEGEQIRLGQKAVVDGNLALRVQNAPDFMDDPSGLINSIKTGQYLRYANLTANGVDDDKISALNNDFAGKAVRSALTPMLKNNPDGAQAYLDQITGSKDNPLSSQDQSALQNIIDATKKQFVTKQKKQLSIETNGAEASVAGKMANGQLTPIDLDNMKGKVTPEFYNLAELALKNSGVKIGSEASRQSKFVSLMEEYGHIHEGDDDQQTAALMKFRKDVMANSTKLEPEGFSKLLSLTDPNFVAVAVKPKSGLLQAGMNFIKDHYEQFMGGKSPAQAISDFFSKAPNAQAEEIPGIAQAAIKADTYRQNPSLMGREDLANNVANQKAGIQPVYGQPTNLKPDQRINAAPTFKAGDVREKGGVKYQRSEDGKWRPLKP